MKKTFKGKNNKIYAIGDLEINVILKNPDLLTSHSMIDLHNLYLQYFGNYSYEYLSILLEKIKLHDKSVNVNSFIYNNKFYWLDKATRVGLMHLVNCSDDYIELVLENNVILLSVEKARHFLMELEKYASKCYLLTLKHLQIAKDLKNLEDILNYDYTSGYPEKIILE